MTRISNKTAYPLDVTISDEDYVIGTDGDNLGKITRNYNIGDLRRYINSGLSPEVGGTLKVSEITYNGVLTSPSEVANALDPNYQVLQYHIVIFSVNGNKYILKEQDITLGLSGTAVTDEDFILIIGFTKLGDGTNVLKGYNTSTGLHEFYSIKKDGNLLNLTESLGNIILSIDETELSAFIKENGKTYSVANVGTGVGIYKFTTVAGDNTQFNFKSIKSNTLNIELTDADVFIDTPETASIPALYVNNNYVPTEEDFLAGNTKGEGTLAKPFTDTVTAYVAGVPTITANTAIQNALDAYVGSGTRLSPERVGEKIIVQDNTTSYIFNGDFNYSSINIKFEGNVGCTTTGWIIDMDNPLYFNADTSKFTINVDEGKYLELIDSLGFRNSGNTSSTPPFFDTGRIGVFMGEGTIYSSYNGGDVLSRYILNSDGNNNDGQVHFLVRCKLRADYQGVYLSKNKARYDFYNSIQSGVYLGSVNTSLQAFRMTGGQIRFFDKGSIYISSETSGRTYGLTFEPENDGIGYCNITLNATKITGNCNYLFARLNNRNVTLNVYNSPSGSDFSTTLLGSPTIVNGLFQNLGVSLWQVTFKNNIFSFTGIDFTKVDLTGGNGTSSINITGDAVIESLRAFSSKENARLAGIPVNSAFLIQKYVDADDLIAGTEYKIITKGVPSLGTEGTYITATGSETGTGVGMYTERCVLV